jgi:hypothetical protein
MIATRVERTDLHSCQCCLIKRQMETGRKAIARLVTKMLFLTVLVDGEKEQRAQRGRVRKSCTEF